MLSESQKLNIRIQVKAYVLYELWLARWCNEHKGARPSEEHKKEAKDNCLNLARQVVT